MHLPAEQVAPVKQRLPQAPQLEVSVCRSLQAAPQYVLPPVQVHLPAVQVPPPAQVASHAPQLVLLALRSAQVEVVVQNV
jgi:hypothetical protein